MPTVSRPAAHVLASCTCAAAPAWAQQGPAPLFEVTEIQRNMPVRYPSLWVD
jgi:hypothetical protein